MTAEYNFRTAKGYRKRVMNRAKTGEPDCMCGSHEPWNECCNVHPKDFARQAYLNKNPQPQVKP